MWNGLAIKSREFFYNTSAKFVIVVTDAVSSKYLNFCRILSMPTLKGKTTSGISEYLEESVPK